MNRTFSDFEAETAGSVHENESGFSLTEFMLSAAILLILSLAIISALNEIQDTASHQADTNHPSQTVPQSAIGDRAFGLQRMKLIFGCIDHIIQGVFSKSRPRARALSFLLFIAG